jgi:riboflavin synthase
MFTGIIENMGVIKSVDAVGENIVYWIASKLSAEFQIDQSVSHDGVCLTVDDLAPGLHRVTAVAETLKKSNLSRWKPGAEVNLERSMILNGRIDGHIVQGHVDTTAICVSLADKGGSLELRFRFPTEFSRLIIEKGSISVNGISLTIFDIGVNEFTVAVIPYTYNHTNIHTIKPGDIVNIEFDILGKYLNRMHELAAN